MSIFSKPGHHGRYSRREQGITLDLERLENVCEGESKTTAACPACREVGHDSGGDHLVIYPEGQFTCVVYQGQNALGKAHRQRIFRLVGVTGTRCAQSNKPGFQRPGRAVPVRKPTRPAGGIVLEPPPRTLVVADEDSERLTNSLAAPEVEEIAVAAEPAPDGTLRLLTLHAPPMISAPAIIDVRTLSHTAAASFLTRLSGKILVVHGAQEVLRLLAKWQPEAEAKTLNFWCTQIAAALVRNGLAGHDEHELGTVLKRYLHITIAENPLQAAQGQAHSTEPSSARTADNARHLLALKKRLAERMSEEGLTRTFSLECRLLPITHELRENGWRLDLPALRAKRERVVIALATPGAANSASLQSRLSQIDGWLRRVGSDGRLRCKYNSLGAVTGRFSASEPNLQNVPRGRLREVFCASEGCSLVIGDLSQIELRIAAFVAGDREMLDIFRNSEDLHSMTASAVLRKALSEVSTEDRQLGKVVNFGLIYGQGVAGFIHYALEQGVDLTETEAVSIRRRFFEAYPGIAERHQQAWDMITPGTLAIGRTVIGRRRYLANSASDWEQFQAHVNHPVQGSAAELFKMALVELHPLLGAFNARLVGVVHDEVIVEAPSAATVRVTGLLKSTFEDAFARLFTRVCEHRFQRKLTELFRDGPACEVQTRVCMNWAAKG